MYWVLEFQKKKTQYIRWILAINKLTLVDNVSFALSMMHTVLFILTVVKQLANTLYIQVLNDKRIDFFINNTVYCISTT